MEETIKQLALVSSVLGGFSFTFLGAILAIKTEKKIKFWVIVSLMVAAMCFLLAALGWSSIDLTKSSGTDVVSHHQNLVKVFLLGLLGIMTSLGLSGWLDDKRTGMATTGISIIALLFLTFGILSRYVHF